MARHHQEKIIYQVEIEDEYLIRQKWYESGENVDCTFIVGSKDPNREHIRANRTLLMMTGSKRLQDALKEHDGLDPIIFPDVDPKIFRLMLSAIYLRRFELKDFDTAVSLAKTAGEFGLDEIAKKCLDYIKSPENLNVNNVIQTYELATNKNGHDSVLGTFFFQSTHYITCFFFQLKLIFFLYV